MVPHRSEQRAASCGGRGVSVCEAGGTGTIEHRLRYGSIEVVCPRCGKWGRLHKNSKGKKHPRYQVAHGRLYHEKVCSISWTAEAWDELNEIYRLYNPSGKGWRERRNEELKQIEKELREEGGRAVRFWRGRGANGMSIYVICPRCGQMGTVIVSGGELYVRHSSRKHCYMPVKHKEWLKGLVAMRDKIVMEG
ncbi:MAG: hypothetical protein ACXQT3_02900 [Methermicoccaceae archaeon]